MARRRRGRRGHKKDRAIPIVDTTLWVIDPALSAFEGAGGINKETPYWLMFEYTGIRKGGTVDMNKVKELLLKVALNIAVKRIVGKTGINAKVKRASGGLFKIS